MPYGDVLLHAGDFTELGLPSEVKKFNDWLGEDKTLLTLLHHIDRIHLLMERKSIEQTSNWL